MQTKLIQSGHICNIILPLDAFRRFNARQVKTMYVYATLRQF